MRCYSIFMLAVAIGWSSTSSGSDAYTFINVADTTTAAPQGTFNSFVASGISGGTAAFLGNYRDYNNGLGMCVLAGNGDGITTIAKTGDSVAGGTLKSIHQWSLEVFGTSISGNTVVAEGFYGNEFYPSVVFTGSGGALTTVAKVVDSAPIGTFQGFRGTSICGSSVTFVGYYNTGDDDGVFLKAGDQLTTIVKRGDVAPLGTFEGGFDGLSTNGANVAFRGIYQHYIPDLGLNSGWGLFVGNGNGLTTIAKTGDIGPRGGSFNEFGSTSYVGDTVAFSASFDNWNRSGVFLYTDGTLSTIAMSGDSGPDRDFASLDSASYNGTDVLFRASYVRDNYFDDPIYGLFLSDGSHVDGIIKTGDSLFGSTLTAVESGGLDESGNVAFWYQLADGRSGIAIGEVPEPNTLVLLGIAGIVMAAHLFRGNRTSRCSSKAKEME
jgi:hypothetical protein